MINEVWCVSIDADRTLLYAPFHGILTLVNRALAKLVLRCLGDETEPVPADAEWIHSLRKPGNVPKERSGPLSPLYLGLIPTRSCMMQCAYCDFHTNRTSPLLSFEQIRHAVDGYAEILRNSSEKAWNMHFFGGEPFAAFKEIVFAVNYAGRRAAELGLPTHFEVTTNGFYSEEKCRWIAENFDTVVLSLDGFPAAQNHQRPGPGGADSFRTVCRSADIFSRGSCELIIRSCISEENAGQLPAWAEWISQRFILDTVCLEPMIESDLARRNGLHPPDPARYIRSWTRAFRILKKEKIRLVCSSGDITAVKRSLCPMGQDALIVSPDGEVGGCWQLAENQSFGGVDLRFGTVNDHGLHIDTDRLDHQRSLSEMNRERCRGCFCYAHCAGGCILSRSRNSEFCRMTRALTLWQLLEQLGYGSLADELLSDPLFIEQLAEQKDFSIGSLRSADTKFRDLSSVKSLDGTDEIPDLSGSDLPPLPEDQMSGWIRDGNSILIADPAADVFRRLDGPEALCFQIEHSGMSPKEIKTVREALAGEDS